jgi:MOSC domain-containing protein YiiM
VRESEIDSMSFPTHSPHIFQINISNGGVPKLGLRQAGVEVLGVTGDQHRDTQHHGGPERAVCLYSLEHILALQAEGHPVFPGSTGENLTLAGLDWGQVAPGTRLRLGPEVLVEVTHFTTPCNNIADSFKDRDYGRISQTRCPGWSRVYARVLETGSVRVGDKVEMMRDA